MPWSVSLTSAFLAVTLPPSSTDIRWLEFQTFLIPKTKVVKANNGLVGFFDSTTGILKLTVAQLTRTFTTSIRDFRNLP